MKKYLMALIGVPLLLCGVAFATNYTRVDGLKVKNVLTLRASSSTEATVQTPDATTSASPDLLIYTGGTTSGSAGVLSIAGGSNTSGSGGDLNLYAGDTTTGTAGGAFLYGGDAGTGGTAGDAWIQGGTGSDSSGGSATLIGGESAVTGGDAIVKAGPGVAGGVDGKIRFKNAGEGSTGDCWVSTDSSGAGHWESCPASSVAPTGAVIMFVGSTCPTGYLALDGSLVSRSTYSALYAIEGDTYGNGNGTTTFTLPNAGGVFIRGSGSQTIVGVTYTGTRGANERDGYQDHTHTYPFGTSVSGGGFTAIMNSSNTGTATSSGGSGRAGTETKPANITLLYCVKT